MKTIAGFAVVVLAAVAVAQEPKMAAPTKEHEWLKQLEGEWVTDAEAVMEPGKPPMTCKGTETCRLLGGFWMVSELKGEWGGAPMTGQMTVGYDAGKKKYVGTWVCSMDGHLWHYEGTVAGKVLTLNTEGPNMLDPTKTAKMRDVVEMKDKDTRVMTSSMQGDDGKWTTFMTITAKRKK